LRRFGFHSNGKPTFAAATYSSILPPAVEWFAAQPEVPLLKDARDILTSNASAVAHRKTN